MDKNRKKELFECIKDRMLQVTEHAKVSEGEDLILTSAFTTIKNSQEKGSVLYEMQYMEMFPNTSQVEINMTLDINIKDDIAIKELEKTIMNLNFFIPMGALGISYKSNQIYSRYTVHVDESRNNDELALYIYQICELLGGVIGSVFLQLKAIANNEMTYEEAVEKKLMIKQ